MPTLEDFTKGGISCLECHVTNQWAGPPQAKEDILNILKLKNSTEERVKAFSAIVFDFKYPNFYQKGTLVNIV
jgi:hypothetical protein